MAMEAVGGDVHRDLDRLMREESMCVCVRACVLVCSSHSHRTALEPVGRRFDSSHLSEGLNGELVLPKRGGGSSKVKEKEGEETKLQLRVPSPRGDSSMSAADSFSFLRSSRASFVGLSSTC